MSSETPQNSEHESRICLPEILQKSVEIALSKVLGDSFMKIFQKELVENRYLDIFDFFFGQLLINEDSYVIKKHYIPQPIFEGIIEQIEEILKNPNTINFATKNGFDCATALTIKMRQSEQIERQISMEAAVIRKKTGITKDLFRKMINTISSN
ncbi:hypothetical protein K9N08_03800 [Candidatus Gracilibacteria bacterium]|nr:hypothetical protein [Candidatus Gracilibacteria bacterium]MCF7856646.1 hypothetical protein [Candidatus Gracilibacteria bacterium]MCF7896963.1 hypothetical protein [Candidatus Gracilibacteria bacterium]